VPPILASDDASGIVWLTLSIRRMAVAIGWAITQPTIFSRWRAESWFVLELTEVDLAVLEAEGVRRKRKAFDAARVCRLRGGDESARLMVSNKVASFEPILPGTFAFTARILPTEPSLSRIPDSISTTPCFALSLISSFVHSRPR